MAMIDDSSILLIILIMIIKYDFILLFIYIPLPNDTKTIDLNLPISRTTSPFSPQFSPTVSGWLLCVSSFIGGCLMQYHHIIAPLYYFLFHIPLPVTKTIYLHLPDDHTASPLSLLPQFSPTVIGWLLCVSLQCHPSMSINPHYIICPPIDNLPYPPPNVQG